MRDFAIPPSLTELLTARRVIPFIGAGFSASQGLPGWDPMLRSLARDVDAPVPYDEIADSCNGDPLQIAEYLYLVSGKTIGPLRHYVGRQLSTPSPFSPAAHVDLVNLGAAQVYTTNFDDLIEQTYRMLDVPAQVVALPRDVAIARDETAQVVKYHGDLRFEQTLVLTESQYYRRLDFESPMDLKFRSDLLGKSVLFMGYSFRDINIRIIWFKLMQMMKDVPDEDRLPSYIVRFDPNPVLEELYNAVGLTTIVLDPESEAKTPEEQSQVFGEFLLYLTGGMQPRSVLPQQGEPMFVSATLLNVTKAEFDAADSDPARRMYIPPPRLIQLLHQLAKRRTPKFLRNETRGLLELALLRQEVRRVGGILALLATAFAREFGSSRALTLSLALAFLRPDARKAALDNLESLDWTLVWQPTLLFEDGDRLLDLIQRDVEGHEDKSLDDVDLAFGIDIAMRIRDGQLLAERDEARELRADELIDRAADMFPSVLSYEPPTDGPPNPQAIRNEIAERVEALGIEPSDDIPF